MLFHLLMKFAAHDCSWQRRFEAQVVPLLDSAETLWNEIGVSDEQRDKVLQRSAADQRNFFEAIVADARLLRDRLLQENALLDNELKSLGSELKLAIPAVSELTELDAVEIKCY